jgi:1,4-alpha-glucan branching enzyme
LSAILRVVFFLVAVGAVGFPAGRRWADAYARFCDLRAVDVSGLLASEAPAGAEAAPAGVHDKQPRAVVFRLRAPEAKGVLLGGSFNEFDARKTPLTRGEGGVWETTLALDPGRYLYKFKVDGQWILDPANPDRASPPREASVLEIR